MNNVSIAICTKDRPAELRRCLACVSKLRSQVLEIIVVDNNSRAEDTRQIAESFAAVYVKETKPGLAAARNCAIAVARGEIIAFTDDDCEPHSGWISALSLGMADQKVGCVTGPATAADNANWIQRQNDAHSPLQPEHPVEISSDAVGRIYFRAALGVGANMAFRRELLRKLNGFPPVLGAEGDDHYMFYKVVQAGFKLQYRPDSIVYQHHRTTLCQHLRRNYEYGIGIQRMVGVVACQQRAPRLFLYNLYWYSSRTLVHSLRHILRGKVVPALFDAAQLLGMASGLLFRSGWRAGVLAPPPAADAFLSCSEKKNRV